MVIVGKACVVVFLLGDSLKLQKVEKFHYNSQNNREHLDFYLHNNSYDSTIPVLEMGKQNPREVKSSQVIEP